MRATRIGVRDTVAELRGGDSDGILRACDRPGDLAGVEGQTRGVFEQGGLRAVVRGRKPGLDQGALDDRTCFVQPPFAAPDLRVQEMGEVQEKLTRGGASHVAVVEEEDE